MLNKTESTYPKIDETRPISLLPHIYKLFERSISHHFAKIENKVSLYQWGFRKGQSIELNIIDIFDLKTWKEGMKPVLLFIDFRWAFDSLDWNILLRKMLTIGLDPTLVHLYYNIFKNTTYWIKGTTDWEINNIGV